MQGVQQRDPGAEVHQAAQAVRHRWGTLLPEQDRIMLLGSQRAWRNNVIVIPAVGPIRDSRWQNSNTG